MAVKSEPVAIVLDDPNSSFRDDQPIQILLNLLTQFVPSAMPFSAYFSRDLSTSDVKFCRGNKFATGKAQHHANPLNTALRGFDACVAEHGHFMRYGVISLWCDSCKQWFSTPVHLAYQDLAHEVKNQASCDTPSASGFHSVLLFSDSAPSPDPTLPLADSPQHATSSPGTAIPAVGQTLLANDHAMTFRDPLRKKPLTLVMPPIDPALPAVTAATVAACALPPASNSDSTIGSVPAIHYSPEASREARKRQRRHKPCKCNTCGRVVQSNKLSVHMRKHTGERPFQCDDCGKAFKESVQLTRHKRQHTGERPYQCDVCDKRLTRASGLRLHKLTHGERTTCRCEICGANLISAAVLGRHMQMHTGERAFACNVCDKGFRSSAACKSHMWRHTGVKLCECDICGKNYSDFRTLMKHKKLHSDVRPFKCDLCSKGYCSAKELENHRRTHTGEKPYVCHFCGKGFHYPGNLSQHRRTHTGEKPHECDICHKRFSESQILVKHKRIHTGEKPFPCDICGRAFTQKSALKTHSRIHSKDSIA